MYLFTFTVLIEKKKKKKDMSKITFDRKLNRAFGEREMINEI